MHVVIVNLDYSLTKYASQKCQIGLYQIRRYHILSSFKCTRTRFRPGLGPGPRWGTLRHSPRLLSRLGTGTPGTGTPPRRLRCLDFGGNGASILRPPPNQIPGYAYFWGGDCVSLPLVYSAPVRRSILSFVRI